jgi:hypothetical protein
VNQLTHGKLIVGLLDPTSSALDFTSFHVLIMREGVTIENQAFATNAKAITYFNDHEFNLGTSQPA